MTRGRAGRFQQERRDLSSIRVSSSPESARDQLGDLVRLAGSVSISQCGCLPAVGVNINP